MKKHRTVTLILFLALLFTLPLVWRKLWLVQVPLFGEVPGVDFAVLALLALAVTAAGWSEVRRGFRHASVERFFLITAGFGVVLSGVQQCLYGWNGPLFLTSLAYFVIPVAGMLLAREIRRVLPCFLLVLFLGSFAISLREWGSGLPAVGVAGNWNWNWTLLAASIPVFGFFFPSRFRKFAMLVLIAGVVVGQFLITPKYASRGTLVAGIGALLILGAMAYLHRFTQWRKPILTGMLLLALIAGAFFYCTVRNGSFVERLPGENRLTLWQGTVALGESAWIAGISPGRFEGEIAPFLPLAYHDSDFAADRHPHPHHELLFYWCAFGVFGVFWWMLTVILGMRGLLHRRRGDELLLLAGWCWLVLLIHGQTDVILHMPLAGGLFLLLTGALAGAGLPKMIVVKPLRRQLVLVIFFILAALVLFTMNLASGYHRREGKLALLARDPAMARNHLERSARILPSPEAIYMLGSVELFDFQTPQRAADTFVRLQSECRLPFYSHSAGRIARALAAAGKPKEALPWFEAEQRNFPRSTVNLRLWVTVLNALGDTEKAGRLEAEWRWLLQYKGLTEAQFPYLLQNQYLDDSPLELKSFLEKGAK